MQYDGLGSAPFSSTIYNLIVEKSFQYHQRFNFKDTRWNENKKYPLQAIETNISSFLTL